MLVVVVVVAVVMEVVEVAVAEVEVESAVAAAVAVGACRVRIVDSCYPGGKNIAAFHLYSLRPLLWSWVVDVVVANIFYAVT